MNSYAIEQLGEENQLELWTQPIAWYELYIFLSILNSWV